MNLYEVIVETIIFHFPVFLNDVLTHNAENADLSLHLFKLQRGTSYVWLAEFEGPPEHSWAVPQAHKPFLLLFLRNHTALYRSIYIGFKHHFDPS